MKVFSLFRITLYYYLPFRITLYYCLPFRIILYYYLPFRITLYDCLLSFGYFYVEHKMFSFVFDVFHVLSVTQENDFDVDSVGSFYLRASLALKTYSSCLNHKPL